MVAVVSLLALVLVIVISYKKSWNPGLCGFCIAFILGFFVYFEKGENLLAVSSIKGGCSVLFNGFNSKLWIRIMLVSIFFAIGQLDGTLNVLTAKFVSLIRGKNKLLPWVFYFLTLILAAVGAGSIGVLILIMPIAAAMAKEQKIDFFLTGIAVAIGGAVGGVSPLAATGIVAVSVSAENGITLGNSLFLHYLLCGTITVTILYILFGGWKYKDSEVDKAAVPKFNKTQIKTLSVIILFAVMAVMGFEIAFVAGMCIGILCILNPDIDQKKIISMAPWPTLVLLGGMGVMVGVVQQAGGISLLTNFLQQFMGGRTAGAIISIIAGFMSFVSSASGVVMPTLIPTVPQLSAVTGASAIGLINAITFGAHQTGISPFSTGGSLILSMGGENIDQRKTFTKLIYVAFLNLAIGCVYSFLGLLG